MGFANLHHDVRMSVRTALEPWCSHFEYVADGLVVAARRGEIRELLTVAERVGLEFSNAWKFPLGSDKPDDVYRHHGPYNATSEDPAYWYFHRFTVGRQLELQSKIADDHERRRIQRLAKKATR